MRDGKPLNYVALCNHKKSGKISLCLLPSLIDLFSMIYDLFCIIYNKIELCKSTWLDTIWWIIKKIIIKVYKIWIKKSLIRMFKANLPLVAYATIWKLGLKQIGPKQFLLVSCEQRNFSVRSQEEYTQKRNSCIRGCARDCVCKVCVHCFYDNQNVFTPGHIVWCFMCHTGGFCVARFLSI
jgi:hypothetical protein